MWTRGLAKWGQLPVHYIPTFHGYHNLLWWALEVRLRHLQECVIPALLKGSCKACVKEAFPGNVWNNYNLSLISCSWIKCLSMWCLHNYRLPWRTQIFLDPFQSHFNSGFVTETALADDLRRAMDGGGGGASLLVLLDLLMAVDTLDLGHCLGGCCSLLGDRFQKVLLGNTCSTTWPMSSS